MKKLLFIACLMLSCSLVEAQLFTMNKRCREAVATAESYNLRKHYDSALSALASISCNTKDAKIAIANIKATAFNGKKEYNSAIAAANEALAISKDRSLFAFYERGLANEALKNTEAATSDFNAILWLSEKNRNTAERATIYEKVADIYFKSGKQEEAMNFLEKAIAQDPSNTDFTMLKGDYQLKMGHFTEAFATYDKALAAGRTDLDMYQTRSKAFLKFVQGKYQTENAQELRSKLTNTEKEILCRELKKAISLGWNDMKIEMLSALICK